MERDSLSHQNNVFFSIFFFKHTIYLKLVLQQQNIKYELISLCFITNLFGIFILVCVCVCDVCICCSLVKIYMTSDMQTYQVNIRK